MSGVCHPARMRIVNIPANNLTKKEGVMTIGIITATKIKIVGFTPDGNTSDEEGFVIIFGDMIANIGNSSWNSEFDIPIVVIEQEIFSSGSVDRGRIIDSGRVVVIRDGGGVGRNCFFLILKFGLKFNVFSKLKKVNADTDKEKNSRDDGKDNGKKRNA